MGDLIICHNCGAKINDDAKECPYCGELNYNGAEKNYMEKLGDIKDSLEDLSHESSREVIEEIAGVGRTLKRSLIIIGVIAIIFGGLLLFGLHSSEIQEKIVKSNSYKNKGAVLWLAENEAMLNDMYDKGKFDDIVAFANENCDSNMFGFRDWEHYDFIEYYIRYSEYKEIEATNTSSKGNLSLMLYDLLTLETAGECTTTHMSKVDLERVNAYGDELHYFYDKYLGINDEERIDEIKQKVCYSNGNLYVDRGICDDVIEEHVK